MGTIKNRNGMILRRTIKNRKNNKEQKQKILRRGGKNSQKNYTKRIIMMV